jgi:hypothetical protein
MDRETSHGDDLNSAGMEFKNVGRNSFAVKHNILWQTILATEGKGKVFGALAVVGHWKLGALLFTDRAKEEGGLAHANHAFFVCFVHDRGFGDRGTFCVGIKAGISLVEGKVTTTGQFAPVKNVVRKLVPIVVTVEGTNNIVPIGVKVAVCRHNPRNMVGTARSGKQMEICTNANTFIMDSVAVGLVDWLRPVKGTAEIVAKVNTFWC